MARKPRCGKRRDEVITPVRRQFRDPLPSGAHPRPRASVGAKFCAGLIRGAPGLVGGGGRAGPRFFEDEAVHRGGLRIAFS